MTVALIRISPLALIAGPWEQVPPRVEIAGYRIDGAQVGTSNGTYRFVDVVLAGDQPTEYHTLNTQSYSLSGNTLTVTRTWTAPTLAAVKVILKNLLNNRATSEWIKSRGAKSVQIETANTNGAANIDAAGTIAAAIAAYQAVTWP